ncbi:DUF3040 domain-containing protein [Pseudonocardia bannensis]|uniref:DUF3040 domain-containing protein n=1 Tax=Pseudonocardia bannensis TaxID=630973 RepID=A0A848DHB4_9PSEU|nr:DUF3040 domain-containing protein [Pseudonocardia bannensis]NMH92047.1 DUF3040 domain-containing protein [Pseudonocardia bannensis]
MLSRDEQRLLAAIERRLRDDDPDLADRLAWGPRTPTRWRRRAGPLLAVLSVLWILLGLVVAEGIVLLGGVALLGLAFWMVGGPRRNRARGS